MNGKFEETNDSSSPLNALLNQILIAAKNRMYWVSIGMALALPGICSALMNESGYSNGKDYKKWCADNLSGEEFSNLTPDDFYSMRCGVLHQGQYGGMKHGISRVIFTFAPMNNNVLHDAYVYGGTEFCRNMCLAVHRWYEANKDDPVVSKNAKNLMQLYPTGLAPYLVGIPLIA